MTRTRVASLVVCSLAVAGRVALAQQPVVQNAVQETRAVTSLARDIGATTGVDPAWIGWQVPMVAGDLDLCSTWNSDDRFVRGAALEDRTDFRPPAFASSASPVSLEAGAQLVVLVRVVDGKLERLRSFTGDCPLDAGQRRLTWLSGVTPAASLDYLRSLTATPNPAHPNTRRLSDSAIGAIALHRDAAAGPVLVDLASRGNDTHTRDLALQWLGRARGPFGFDYLTRTLATATEPGLRRQLTSSLARTRENGTTAALHALARSDSDERVRAEALYTYAMLAPSPADVTVMIASDTASEVRSRGISGLLRRPSRDAIAPLITLARTTTDPGLKKEIVRGLSRVDDQPAVSFLEELVRR